MSYISSYMSHLNERFKIKIGLNLAMSVQYYGNLIFRNVADIYTYFINFLYILCFKKARSIEIIKQKIL